MGISLTSRHSTYEVGGPGDTPVFNDMLGSISVARVPVANAPSWENITLDGFATQVLAFDVGEYIDLFVQTEHGHTLNQIVDNHIHWTIATDDAGDEFRFQVTGVGAGVGDAFQSIGTLDTGDVLLAGGEAGKHNITEIGNIPAINTTVSTIYILRLRRVAINNGNETTRLIYVLFNDSHVLIDQIGSRTEYTK